MNDLSVTEAMDIAIKNLFLRRTLQFDQRTIHIAFLIREADQRPLDAPWWHGKEVYLIGVDLDGNFLLHHCNGLVLYWDHKTKSESVVAKSTRDFLGMLQNTPFHLPKNSS